MSIIKANKLTKEFIISEKKNFKDYMKLKSKKKIIRSVSDVSFNIDPNETVGLIGLNGAGKSTLIKMMTGILAPTYGEIKVLGNDPFKDRIINNRKISTVFGQRCKLRRDVSPIESYYLIRDMYGVDKNKFNERISYFSNILGISSFIDNPVRTLSLGQKMKAELAGAFIYDPKIIFLDEPTVGLDVLTKDSILNFLNSIKGMTTIILTTHDLEDIEKICDRVIIIHKGKIIHDSPTKEIENIYNMERLEVTFKRLNKNIEDKFNIGKYDYIIDNNVIKIDVSNVSNKSDLIKSIYQSFSDDINYVQFSKIGFKDSLKYFLKEQL